jgi:multidrug efflux pump subunit AcrA (membrane-fusion protein)
MNERTKTFLVEAIFETPPKLLYPNLTVEANILLQTRENVLTIPRSYLIGDTAVIMADESRQKVEVGLKDFQKAEIRSGLSANDEIILP